MSALMIALKPVGLQTHASGEQYVSFRVVNGDFPHGPWRDIYFIVAEGDFGEFNTEAVNQ